MQYFTSDHHFFHKNIIEYCNRPFKSSWEMNEILVQKWNEKIQSPKNEVYWLGDIALYKSDQEYQVRDLLNRLNGKIYLVYGNHDERNLKFLEKTERFEWIKSYYELKINKKKIKKLKK